MRIARIASATPPAHPEQTYEAWTCLHLALLSPYVKVEMRVHHTAFRDSMTALPDSLSIRQKTPAVNGEAISPNAALGRVNSQSITCKQSLSKRPGCCSRTCPRLIPMLYSPVSARPYRSCAALVRGHVDRREPMAVPSLHLGHRTCSVPAGTRQRSSLSHTGSLAAPPSTRIVPCSAERLEFVLDRLPEQALL